MIQRILAILAALLITAHAGGTLTSSTTTYTQEGLAEGFAYQISAGGTWAGATITVAVFNHTLGDYVNVTTLTSTSSTKRIRATGQKLRATISGGSGTESLAFEALRLPQESANPTAAELAAIINEDPAGALATTGSAVWVTFANGSRLPYAPTANTNAARGAALDAAWTACLATTGAETVDLYPATFDCARATSTVISVPTQFAMEAGMIVRFNGATVTHGSGFSGAVIFAADTVDDWSILGPGIIQGTGTASTTPPSGANEIGINTRTARRWRIADITVRYFKNTGIQFNSSSYTGHGTTLGSNLKISTGQITNCHIDYNNIGFGIYAAAEYPKLTGCSLNNNATGADIYGANTHFANCEASGNVSYALRIRGHAGNEGHGSWVGGAITHNVGHAVHVEAAMTSGFMISGTTFGGDSATSNKIESLGAGLTLSGCYVESPFYAASTPAGMNQMMGCFIAGSYTTVTGLDAGELAKWRFKENYDASGAWANNN